jgi:hypothetical protein
VNKDSDIRDRQNYKQLSSDLRVQDDVTLRSSSEHTFAAELHPPIEPANLAENEDSDITLEQCDEVAGSDIQSCADNSDVKQSISQRTDDKNPQLIDIEEVKERIGLASDACRILTMTIITGDSDNLSMYTIASCTSASVSRTTVIARSPSMMPSIKPITPERTLSLIGLRGATSPKQIDDYEQGCLDLLDQVIDEFVNNSYKQV